MKRVPLLIEGIQKGYLFLSKRVHKKGKGLHLEAEPTRIKLY